MVQKSSSEQLNIKLVYQRERIKTAPLVFFISLSHACTVANLVTRVDMDTSDDSLSQTPSQLTQYAMELLTGSLTQLGPEMHSQGIIGGMWYW